MLAWNTPSGLVSSAWDTHATFQILRRPSSVLTRPMWSIWKATGYVSVIASAVAAMMTSAASIASRERISWVWYHHYEPLLMDRLLELTHRAEQTHFWFRGFRAFIEPELVQAVAGRTSPVLVDCGCGTGANVTWFERYGRSYGFDVTWNGLTLGRQMGRTRLAHASICAIPLANEFADVATSFDVFQHLSEDGERTALEEMKRILKPGGHLIMNVAALEMLHGHHAVLAGEVRRYTAARLRAIVEAAGFEIVRVTFTFASLFPVILPVRLAQRWSSGGTNVPAGEFDITVPPAPINGLLSAVVRAEAAALRVVNMPIGSSLLCHAIKPPGPPIRRE